MQTPDSLEPTLTTAPESQVSAEPEHCLNCGAERTGPYCQQCGQRHASLIAPFSELISELAGTFLKWDNRLFATLSVLFFKPGQLTVAYLSGQRIRYVSPIRLYLLFSIIYFFIASLSGSTSLLFIDFTGGDIMEDLGRVLPKMMFVIVPVFAWVLGLLFRRPGRLYAEHLIFALHLHAFWFVLFSLDAVLSPLEQRVEQAESFPWILLPALILSFLVNLGFWVYLFMALRRVYAQPRARTFGKMMVLIISYLVLLGLAAFGYILLLASGAGNLKFNFTT